MSIDQLEAEALKLNADDRARLAESLLQSLEGFASSEIQGFWIAEALRRDAEMDVNHTVSRPAEEVFRDARARLA